MSFISLGVDTSHGRGQICLFQQSGGDGFSSQGQTRKKRVSSPQCLESVFFEGPTPHSEELNKQFSKLMEKHQLSPKDLGAIYCSIGPGSFTGLRVGVNFCKTLAYGLSCAIYPVSTLHLLASICQEKDQNILASVDAQKNAVFLSLFSLNPSQSLEPVFENQWVPIEKLGEFVKAPVYSCGQGLDRYKNWISLEVWKLLETRTPWKNPDIRPIMEKDPHDLPPPCSWRNLNPLYLKESFQIKSNALRL